MNEQLLIYNNYLENAYAIFHKIAAECIPLRDSAKILEAANIDPVALYNAHGADSYDTELAMLMHTKWEEIEDFVEKMEYIHNLCNKYGIHSIAVNK